MDAAVGSDDGDDVGALALDHLAPVLVEGGAGPAPGERLEEVGLRSQTATSRARGEAWQTEAMAPGTHSRERPPSFWARSRWMSSNQLAMRAALMQATRWTLVGGGAVIGSPAPWRRRATMAGSSPWRVSAELMRRERSGGGGDADAAAAVGLRGWRWRSRGLDGRPRRCSGAHDRNSSDRTMSRTVRTLAVSAVMGRGKTWRAGSWRRPGRVAGESFQGARPPRRLRWPACGRGCR